RQPEVEFGPLGREVLIELVDGRGERCSSHRPSLAAPMTPRELDLVQGPLISDQQELADRGEPSCVELLHAKENAQDRRNVRRKVRAEGRAVVGLELSTLDRCAGSWTG